MHLLRYKISKFSRGGDAPNPLTGGVEGDLSRTYPPPPDDLRCFSPPVVRRPLRGRLFGPNIPAPAISRSATVHCLANNWAP